MFNAIIWELKRVDEINKNSMVKWRYNTWRKEYIIWYSELLTCSLTLTTWLASRRWANLEPSEKRTENRFVYYYTMDQNRLRILCAKFGFEWRQRCQRATSEDNAPTIVKLTEGHCRVHAPERKRQHKWAEILSSEWLLGVIMLHNGARHTMPFLPLPFCCLWKVNNVWKPPGDTHVFLRCNHVVLGVSHDHLWGVAWGRTVEWKAKISTYHCSRISSAEVRSFSIIGIVLGSGSGYKVI